MKNTQSAVKGTRTKSTANNTKPGENLEETASSSGGESTDSDGSYKPYKNTKKPNKIKKALTNVKEKVIDALKPAGKGKKEATSKTKEGAPKAPAIESTQALDNTDANISQIVKQSVKAATEKIDDTDGAGKSKTKQQKSKLKIPVEAGRGNSAALRNDRKQKLIGNLKLTNVHKLCNKKTAQTVEYIKAKVKQTKVTQEDKKLPNIGEEIVSKLHTYKIVKKIGLCCFGAVYSVQNEDGKIFAMKVALKEGNEGLSNECRTLLKISAIESPHFCNLIDNGKVPKRFNYIVVTLAERNVSQLMKDGPLSIGTAVAIAQQSLLALKDLHSIGCLHRDIKAENLVVSTDEYHKVMLVDYGLCGKLPQFEEQIVGSMPNSIPYFVGSLHGGSLAALKCFQQSRKDDLESWCYMILEIFGAILPWAKTTDICEIIQLKERFHIVSPLRQQFFSSLPTELHTIFAYVVSLDYFQIPDYDTLHKILGFILQTSKVAKDFSVSWDPARHYSPPPLALSYTKTVNEIGPYYNISNKKDKYNVIFNGETHNFVKKIAKIPNAATFVCNQSAPDGTNCQRKLRVLDYYDDEIRNGDFVHILTIADKHTCKKFGLKSEEKKNQNRKESDA